MSNVLSREEISRLSEGGRHCSQVVVGPWAKDMGIDEEKIVRIMAPFGGGGFHGELCGAVSGGLAVIGAFYGHYEFGDDAQDEIMIEKTREFTRRFEERFGSVVCRELLKDYGLDYAREGELARAGETTASEDVCRKCMRGALEILEEIIGKKAEIKEEILR